MVTPETEISTNIEPSKKMEEIVYHKLQYKWTLWAHLPQDSDWTKNSYKPIFTFTNVEEVIAILNVVPETMVKNCMLFIMREGVMPMWEDPKNRNGGCFSYKVSNKNVCDVWRDLTYALVGDSISNNKVFVNSVTGITISPKKNFCIIKIWMYDCNNQNPAIVTNEVKNLPTQGCLFKKHEPEF
jgi:hypothetical protein